MNKFSFVELAIMQMLDDGTMHGYAMTQAMARHSGGTLNLPAGSLYPALHKLERAGLIRSRDERSGGRRRRVYGLTGEGARALEREVVTWRSIVKTMDALLGGA